MSNKLTRALKEDRQKIAKAVDETIEDTIRQAWLPNTAAWIGVVVGAFVLNLLLLVLVTGG